MKIAKKTIINPTQNEDLIASLQNSIAEKNQSILKKDQRIQNLEHQLHLFRTAKFGRKSEKFIPESQGDLFDEAEEEIKDSENDSAEETITYTRKKNKTGRKALSKSLPYIENIHDLTTEEKQCACGCELSHIIDEISEKLDILPQVTFRVVNIRKKYACKSCEQTIKTAAMPKSVIEKSIATPGLLAAIIDSKFNRHLPLYRQEQIFSDMGSPITRGTMGKWLIKISEHLSPLIKLMHDKILNHPVAFADETPLKVLKDENGKKRSKSYIWLFIGGDPNKRCFIYQYQPTRRDKVAADFFDGFQGYIHADCYSAYVNIEKQKNIWHAACNAHARRKFTEVITPKNKKGIAHQILTLYSKLYTIEKELKEKQASVDEVYNTRQTKSKALLLKLKDLLDDAILKVLPKSPLGKAIRYTIKHWPALIRYLDDGRLEIDNNRSERAIKPFVIGRKNWLFHGNHKGAEAGAMFYSLIETCKANKVDVFAYFKFMLAHIKQCKTADELEKLLPFNVDISDLIKQRVIPKLNLPV